MNKKMYKKLQTGKLNHTDIFCITWLHSRSKVSFLSSIHSNIQNKRHRKTNDGTQDKSKKWYWMIWYPVQNIWLWIAYQGDTDKSGKKKKKALYLTSFKLSALRWSCIDNKAQSRGPFVKYSQNVSYLVDYMVIILFFYLFNFSIPSF